MEDPDIRLVEGLIGEYYFGAISSFRLPPDHHMREFGYQRAGREGMHRHVQIRDEGQMRILLIGSKPSDVYCSNARYLLPSEEKDRKDWQGASLIFDIDAKDLALPCRGSHVVHACRGCKKARIMKPGCSCGSSRPVSLPCADCIGAAKAETGRLVDLLVEDLGIPGDAIEVYFSGNEGFHIHVEHAPFHTLGRRERAAIARYVSFKGAIPEAAGLHRGYGGTINLEASMRGWRGRLAAVATGATYKKMASRSNKERYRQYAAFLEEAAPRIGARIDPVVTSDIHRIFRMPSTINGKSGMLKQRCNNLEGASPHTDAVCLPSRKVAIRAWTPAPVRLGGGVFGPYDGEEVEVPGYAAAYMVLAGLATSC